MQKPLVSIIIPCFNAERYVREAIQSALNQRYPSVEVIVVDDGSSDGSLDVIQSFGNDIKWLTGKNIGGSAARNRGVRIAQGELLQFLDADDVLYPEKLERQVPFALLHRPGLVFCDADVVDMITNRRLARWGSRKIDADDAVIYLLKSVLPTASPLHWKETFWSVGGFREDLRRCQDPDLHFRLACSGVRFHHLQEDLWKVRRVEGSVSDSNRNVGVRMHYQVGLEALSRIFITEQVTPERRHAFAGYFAKTARVALRLGDTGLAHEIFQTAHKIDRDRGISQAYSPGLRPIVRALGPGVTEHLVNWKNWMFRQRTPI